MLGPVCSFTYFVVLLNNKQTISMRRPSRRFPEISISALSQIIKSSRRFCAEFSEKSKDFVYYGFFESNKKMKHTIQSAGIFVLIWHHLLFPLFSNDREFKVSPLKTSRPPQIDGRLDDPVWETAPVMTDFIQFEPQRGQPASVKTEVRVAYDDTHLYFGFTASDPHPEKIVLGTQRDGLQMGTDSVCVTLDTFHDRRTAYYFRTNPQGVQHDGRISDNGRVADLNWDGIWESAGAFISGGWTAEIAIPLTTVKHRKGTGQTWGIQSSRYYPRNLEKSFWTGPLEDYRKMDRNGTMAPLDLNATANKSEFVPHVISRLQKGEPAGYEAGIDVRYDFTPSLSGHLTVNPDFATVEADQEQVNLTRFELNLPEKRKFFLEGNAVYQQRIQLFYSRRIADIYGGLKGYGKAGRNEIAFLSAQTREEELTQASANFTAFRLKRDIMDNSTVGFLAANRLINGQNQGTAGLDAALYLTDTVQVTGQAAVSYGPEGKTDLGFFLRPSYDSSSVHVHLRYTYLGQDFGENVNAVGFIRDDNRHEFDSAVKKIFWPRGRVFDRIEYSSNYNIYWGMDKTLRSWDVWQALGFELRNKLGLTLRHEEEYKLFEKEFRNRQTRILAGYNTREWESVALTYIFGRNFDADFDLIGAEFNHKLTRDLSVEYSLSRLVMIPDPDDQSTWIHSLKMTQYFHKDLFLNIFLQSNSVIDKRTVQVVFAYRFQPPFGLVQLAYQRGNARFGVKGDLGDTLFIKTAYVF
jgi:hypothetical protein